MSQRTDDKDKVKIIIVDSVKGGCGKSTTALSEAIKLKAPSRGEVCIIDMDLLGTAMECMLSGEPFIRNDKNSPENIKKKAKYFLNDLLGEGIAISDEFINEVTFNIDRNTECSVDFVLSSSDDRDRRKFKVSNNSNYSMYITPTHFRGALNKLTKYLIESKYKTLIFDMPPNSDVYTDCVFDLFLDQNSRNDFKNLGEVELILVSTYDSSHVYANTNWLKELLESADHHWAALDSIVFFLNNTSIAETDVDFENKRNVIKTYVKEKLPKMPENDTSVKIQFKYREYSKKLMAHFLFKSDNVLTDFTLVTPSDWYTPKDF